MKLLLDSSGLNSKMPQHPEITPEFQAQLEELLGLTPPLPAGSTSNDVPLWNPPQEEGGWGAIPWVLGAGAVAALHPATRRIGRRLIRRGGADDAAAAVGRSVPETDIRRLLPERTTEPTHRPGQDDPFEQLQWGRNQLAALDSALAQADPATRPQIKAARDSWAAEMRAYEQQVKDLTKVQAKAAKESDLLSASTDRITADRMKRATDQIEQSKAQQQANEVARVRSGLTSQGPTVTRRVKGDGETLTERFASGDPSDEAVDPDIINELKKIIGGGEADPLAPTPPVSGASAAPANVSVGPGISRDEALAELNDLRKQYDEAITAHKATNDPADFAKALDTAALLADRKTTLYGKTPGERVISQADARFYGQPIGHMRKHYGIPIGAQYRRIVDRIGNVARSAGIDVEDTRSAAADMITDFHAQHNRGGTQKEYFDFAQRWIPEHLGPNPTKRGGTVTLRKSDDALAAGQQRAAARQTNQPDTLSDVVDPPAPDNGVLVDTPTGTSAPTNPIEQAKAYAISAGLDADQADAAVRHLLSENPDMPMDEVYKMLDFAASRVNDPPAGATLGSGFGAVADPAMWKSLGRELKGAFGTQTGGPSIADTAVAANRFSLLSSPNYFGNAFIGPWSAIPWTAAEKGVSTAIKPLLRAGGYKGPLSDASVGQMDELIEGANPLDFMKNWVNAADEAKTRIGVAERAEMPEVQGKGFLPALNRILQLPGRGMMQGDIAAKQTLAPVIGPQKAAEQVLVPPNPYSRAGKSLVDAQRGGGPIWKFALPFAKTPIVSVEEAFRRNPITEQLANKHYLQQGRVAPSTLDERLARQVTGGAAAAGGYKGGQKADAWVDGLDMDPAAKTMLKGIIFGLSGVAGGPNSTLMRAGFGAGQLSESDPSASNFDLAARGARGVIQDSPMPTTESATDIMSLPEKIRSDEFEFLQDTPLMPKIISKVHRAYNP